jgi:predicted DNA-binding transcriptional regulator AlpA
MLSKNKHDQDFMAELEAGFYIVPELAALLRVSPVTVYRRWKNDQIPGGRKCGGRLIFSKRAIAEWIEQGADRELPSVSDSNGAQP